MIYFHIIFDLKDLYGYPLEYASGVNYYIGKLSVILFMLLSGISCTLSKNNVKRGIRVLAIALLITLATHLYSDALGVKFGVLHFLGLSMILYEAVKKANPYVLLAAGVIIIIAGNLFGKITMSHDIFFIFNLTSNSFYSSDYYPLFPWLGIFLFGIVIGKLFYSSKESLLPFSIKENPISKAGRHTLILYVIHQPLILVILSLLHQR